MSKDKWIKGRGAQNNPDSKYSQIQRGVDREADPHEEAPKTQFFKDHPKSVVNPVTSPDLNFEWSINPYQGCEHGCSYCYARNTHQYYEWSAGLDFETKIVVKENAPELLEKCLQKASWKASPIMLSGNTDCYQPAERQYQITRKLLQVFQKYNHPVSIITKNDLILRDKDILQDLAQQNLVRLAISITTMDDELRRKMEPRTSTGLKRVETIRQLREVGVPAGVMMGPIIPGLNDREIFDIAKRTHEAGALFMAYNIVRLNGALPEIFGAWIRSAYPEKADRVLHQIEECHDGSLSDSRFGDRQRGTGKLADIIRAQVKIAQNKFFKDKQIPKLNLEAYNNRHGRQMTIDF